MTQKSLDSIKVAFNRLLSDDTRQPTPQFKLALSRAKSSALGPDQNPLDIVHVTEIRVDFTGHGSRRTFNEESWKQFAEYAIQLPQLVELELVFADNWSASAFLRQYAKCFEALENAGKLSAVWQEKVHGVLGYFFYPENKSRLRVGGEARKRKLEH